MRLLVPLLLFGLAVPAIAQHQTAEPTRFTLDECIQYALENAVSIKNASIDEEIADARVKETRGIGLPQIDGAVSLQHNHQMSPFFARAEVAEQLGGVALNGLDPSDVIAAPNFFQLPSSGNASISVNQLLFNGSYLVGLKAANAYRELSRRSSRQTREEVIQQVSKAYYTVLINNDRLTLLDNNISRVDSLLKTTEAMYRNGFAESIDVDRVRVAFNNLTTERDKFHNLQELSLQLLKFQMNYPMNAPLEVEGDIASLEVDERVLQEYAVSWDYTQRSDYQLLEANRNLQQLDVRNKIAAGMPSLSAFATAGYLTQSPNIGGLFVTNTNLEETDMIGPDKWYDYSLFGVSLNVPIFSGLQRSYRLQQSKLNLMKIENSFTTLRQAIDLEVKQAATNYLNAIKTLESQRENTALAERVARVTKIKFEQGVGSNLEVIDAESALKEAQTNYYSALYDALVARVDLDKAYGKLVPAETE